VTGLSVCGIFCNFMLNCMQPAGQICVLVGRNQDTISWAC
jgi:hypothetical protein